MAPRTRRREIHSGWDGCMKAVYEVPQSRKQTLLAVTAVVAVPALMVAKEVWLAADSSPGTDWYLLPLLWLPALFWLFWAIRGARQAGQQGRLELEGNQLSIRFGRGILDSMPLWGSRNQDGVLVVDLSETHLEWAGQALNLRNREFGTLTLGYGDPAKPLAEWLTAQGHVPVRAY